MVRFLLYLFESGVCLTILFLVYLLFFRKETFFQFNRIYLLSIITLSLIIPLTHLNFKVNDSKQFEPYFEKIGQLKTSYEQVISLSNPKSINSDNLTAVNSSVLNNSDSNLNSKQAELNPIEKESKNHRFSLLEIFFLIYIAGVLLFSSRLFVLYKWMRRTISKSKREQKKGHVLVKVERDIPPFSFFKFIFLSLNTDRNKLKQIFEHELVHIEQKHSFDLVLAQIVAILHWFNPLVWFLQKTIKTNHEFIADKAVINKGNDILNYQELLLNQFISIPTIQLTNSFNLTNIKKRIYMMNSSKSKKIAKLKPIFIIPFALFAFVLFSNLTLYSPNSTINNYSIVKNHYIGQLKGMWINESSSTFGKYILFENTKFSLLEQTHILKEYPYQIADNKIILNLPNKEKAVLKYKLTDDELKVWWGDAKYSTYKKSNKDNTLDDYLSGLNLHVNLPTLTNYKILGRPELCINIVITDGNYTVNDSKTSFENLENKIISAKSKINALYESYVTVCIYVDTNAPMNFLTDLKQILRKNNLLKICYMGIAEDSKVSKLETKFIGIPRKLPPLPSDKNYVEIIEIVPDSVSTN
jgi:beta-lactamase regulating signal transducer with metallopeptidase domain/biopolymer transport protein ExbD